MKKIVGILAVAAMATSMFAADVSAKVRLEGSLFKYDAGTKGISAMEIEHAANQNWNPVISLSTSGDVAGAEVSFYNGTFQSCGGWNSFYTVGAKVWKIWFSPIDGLKVKLGSLDASLNQEMIDWSNTKSGCDSQGYGLSYAKDAIAFDVFLMGGWDKAWMTKDDGADVAIGETYVKFQYNGGDIGTINAMLDAKNTFKDLTFGVGYKNTFSGITVFENVLGMVANEKFTTVRSETYAQGNVDAFAWAVWLPVDIDVNGGDPVIGTIAKVSYALDACTPYLYVKSENWLSDPFKVEIKPGVTGNVGAMAWEVAADINVAGSDVSFNVPVNFTVNF